MVRVPGTLLQASARFALPLLCGIWPLALSVGRNLEYEYVWLLSISALFLLPLTAIYAPLGPPPRKNDLIPIYRGRFLWACAGVIAAGMLPGALLLGTGVCRCTSQGFVFWQFFLSAPALLLAAGLSLTFEDLRRVGKKRRHLLGGLLFFYFFIFVVDALLLWKFPQKRLISIFFGFIHGPIYDSWIAIDRYLVATRLSHIFIALSIIWFSCCYAKTLRRAGSGVLLLIAAMLWIFTFDKPSVGNGKKYLDRTLTGEVKGTGFTIHYVDETPQEKEPPLAVRRLSLDTKFHLQELQKLFEESNLRHVSIYAYPSAQDKKLWFGGGSTDVTDVVTPSIHITLGSWPHPTLRHELVHAVASAFAYKGLGFHPNMAFTEGLAIALAPEPRGVGLDEGSAALIDSGRIPSIKGLFSPWDFWQESGSRAYTVAGSFIQFLIEHYGIGAVKQLYSGKNWFEAVGASEQDVLSAWEKHIKGEREKVRIELEVEALYREPGILQDVCPHSKAELERARSEGLFSRLRQPPGWDPQEDLLPWRLRLNPLDREAKVDMLRREIRKTTSERTPDLAKVDAWLHEVHESYSWPPKHLEDVELALLESDLARVLSRHAESMTILKDLRELARRTSVGIWLERHIEARLIVEKDINPEKILEWRRYLAGWRSIPEASLNDPWITSYLKLKGRSLVNNAKELLALTLLPVDDDAPLGLRREWYLQLAMQLMESGSPSLAATQFEQFLQYAKSAEKPYYELERRRAQFYATQEKAL